MGKPTDGSASDFGALPRYQQAAHHRSLLCKLIVAIGLLLVAVISLLWFSYLAAWREVLVLLLAVQLLLLAVVQSAFWMTHWRHRLYSKNAAALPGAFSSTPQWSAARATQQAPARQTFAWLFFRGAAFATTMRKLAGLLRKNIAGLLLLALAASGLIVAAYGWRFTLDLPPSADLATPVTGGNSNYSEATGASTDPVAGATQYLFAIGLLTLAFALLVIERYYGANRQHELPEAAHLVHQLRVALTATLLLSFYVLLGGAASGTEDRAWLAILPAAVGLLVSVICAEMLLRLGVSVFAPPATEPRFRALSGVAALWQWPLRPFGQIQDQLKSRFGIDLRQSWAFAFIRRALLPVASVLVGIAWLLSGLLEVPIAARGVYERFGKPQAVWQSGIHLGLPWPLGRVRMIDNGVVHELTAGSASDDSAFMGTELSTAEGPAPETANRLWDASHVAEKSQVIASQVKSSDGDRQSFQIVNIDVRLMYRIGLGDRDALNAHYNSDDIPKLIRSTTNRILVKFFASRTLQGVLGETRTEMANEIGSLVQAQLDELASGVEIVATVVEAIHPPAAAANAYHAVQAAQIQAQSIIARQRGNAAELVNIAAMRGDIVVSKATAAARETMARAEAAERRFSAEQMAFARGGRAFLFEQYLGQLDAGLDEAELVLIDHRLADANATLDLRDFSTPDRAPMALGD